MLLLKLERRYLNLEHVTSVYVVDEGVEVVTPYEVLRLAGSDAQQVRAVFEWLAEQNRQGLDTVARD